LSADVSEPRLDYLYLRFRAAIYQRCRRLLADPAAAEDATQVTFLRLHEHPAALADTQQAFAWLYRTATNHCLNELRSRSRRGLAFRPAGQLVAGQEGRLTDRDLLRRLALALPEGLFTAAWLYHVDGVEQAEIAQRLGVSRRTVISRLNRVSRSARALLE
jgi:RNA polymerase sigma-70 factor, ECF subfamily